MPTPSPTIRLFVSSTFSDLKAERDALQREVFPRLKQLCLSKGLRFQAIDLRWGISEEAGRDNRTMRICLRELRRCQQDRPKPNFLILLGDRYGWRPLPEIIPATLFEKLEQETRATDAKAAKLLTDGYRRDDNAVPPVYELQPRGDSANWHEQVEKPLLAALEQAAQILGLDLDAEGVSIGASATEQEIIEGALKVPDAATHVRAFFRTIEGLPDKPPSDFVETGDAANRLKRLKERIGGHIGDGNVSHYRVPWRGNGINADNLKEFCEQAWKQLSAVVEQQIAALAKVPPDEQEEHAHQDFGKERCRRFVGRAEPLERIAKYLREGTGRPLAVVGPSGSGKSAVMAKAVAKVTGDEWQVASGKPEMIGRFIGATPSSSDLIQLLRNLVGEIRKRYPASVRSPGFSRSGSEPGADAESRPPEGGTPSEKPDDSEIPFEYNPLIAAFHEALQRPTADRPLFLFLDALDQLTASHNAHSLAWLPGSLSPHVRLIVSAALPTESGTAPVRSPAFTRSGPPEGGTPNDPRATIMAALASRLDAEQRIALAPLTVADGEQMLTNWLADAHRTLRPAQRQAILETFKVEGSPLWLRTGAEEASRLASWQPAPSFAPTTPGLLGQVLDRLSQEEEHGDKLVSRTLSYLACARHGLAEDEILDILSADKEVMADFRRRSPNSPKVDSLPVAVWVRLHGDLAFYLAEHQAQGASLLGFYHRSFLEAVTAHCFASRETRETRHQHLSVYFLDCAKGPDPAKEWETDAVRGFAECVFHLVKAGQHERAAGLLSNFPFLLHKLRVGLIEGVFEDYDMVRCEAPAEVGNGLEVWSSFFREKAHILRRGSAEWPAHKILLQLAVEHADDSPLTVGAETWLAEDHCDWLWLRRFPRLDRAGTNPCMAVLEGHTSWVKGALELRDGRILSWSGEREVSWSRLDAWEDCTLRLWDGQSGRCRKVLEGHTHSVWGALELSDGRLLSWSADKTLRVWDGQSGECLEVLEAWISGALELPDGRILSWGGKTLRLWDSQSGECQEVLEGHSTQVHGVLVLSDGRILSWSGDHDSRSQWKDCTLRLWDSQGGQCQKILEGHPRWVLGALELSDRRILSWSDDETMRIWDLQSGECRMVLEGNQCWVLGALELSDGRILSWTQVHTLRLWDIQSGECQEILEGHTSCVSGALELRDGRILSWSRHDKTLRLWDSRSGECRSVLRGHVCLLEGVLELQDGRILSWTNEVGANLQFWSKDFALRLWDGQSRECGKVLQGHTSVVCDVLVMSDGRILSWSWDNTLRLWDNKSGECQAVFEGHAARVEGVLELSGGRILSWSSDKTWRIWDGQSGDCRRVLEEHTGSVSGALELNNGRILSWGGKTLRVWDSQSWECRAVLEGHTSWIRGALELSDRRILSWSDDETMRIWDGQSGECRRALGGHTDSVWDALELSDGRILSWGMDNKTLRNTLRLWDGQSGECCETVPEDELDARHPEWRHTRENARRSEAFVSVFCCQSFECSAYCFADATMSSVVVAWQAESNANAVLLMPDGTFIVTQANGQVCILKLHHGNRRISFTEAEALLLGRKSAE